MFVQRFKQAAVAAAIAFVAAPSFASLTIGYGITGNVGLSVDGIGSNLSPVGEVQAVIPVGATVLKAYLYTAGTPFPYYPNNGGLPSPSTLAEYNAAGITLAGNAITNYDTLVGATSLRADIGRWYTGRADVTSLVQSLVAGAVTDSFSWVMSEGRLNSRIDGSVLAIAYSHASLPEGSVVFLDGGQNTGGETTNVNFAEAIGDPNAGGFAAALGVASSFSCCSQQSRIRVNGDLLTEFAGNFDDGLALEDGSLITVGGLGDNPANNTATYEEDDELYDLRPFLATGDTGFSINTFNATNDDNIFFAHLYTTAKIDNVNDNPINRTPLPATLALALAGLGLLGAQGRRRGRQVAA